MNVEDLKIRIRENLIAEDKENIIERYATFLLRLEIIWGEEMQTIKQAIESTNEEDISDVALGYASGKMDILDWLKNFLENEWAKIDIDANARDKKDRRQTAKKSNIIKYRRKK